MLNFKSEQTPYPEEQAITGTLTSVIACLKGCLEWVAWAHNNLVNLSKARGDKATNQALTDMALLKTALETSIGGLEKASPHVDALLNAHRVFTETIQLAGKLLRKSGTYARQDAATGRAYWMFDQTQEAGSVETRGTCESILADSVGLPPIDYPITSLGSQACKGVALGRECKPGTCSLCDVKNGRGVILS